MFGKLGDMSNMLKKAYEMKKEMDEVKKELDQAEVKGKCGTSVEVTITGGLQVKNIKIAPEAVKEGNSEKIEEFVLIAINNAIEEAKKMSQQKMSKITGGLNIPGLF